MADRVRADQSAAEQVRIPHGVPAGLCPVCELRQMDLGGICPRGGPDRLAFERKKRLVLRALESQD